MVATSRLTVVDTNVFVIDLRYRRDPSFAVNQRFLRRLARDGNGATTIYNLLELCGILSFNLSEPQLRELFSYFSRRFSISVLPSAELDVSLPTLNAADVFAGILRKASFGDALISAVIAKHVPTAARFVSWDADHFRGKLAVAAVTPREFLRGKS